MQGRLLWGLVLAVLWCAAPATASFWPEMDVVAVADDASRAIILTAEGIDPKDTNRSPDLYLVDSDGGHLLGAGGIAGSYPQLVGASRDARRVLFLSYAPL